MTKTDTEFRSTQELFDAGYALMQYSIGAQWWRFKDKDYQRDIPKDQTEYVDFHFSDGNVHPVKVVKIDILIAPE